MGARAEDGRRVVARFQDGRVLKGTTHDFAPHKSRFHLFLDGDEFSKPLDVPVGALKALFFVKTWVGDAKRIDDNTLTRATGQGRRLLVTFSDGEVIAGFTMGYAADKPGFFFIPADPDANNTRVFVVKGAMATASRSAIRRSCAAWTPTSAAAR